MPYPHSKSLRAQPAQLPRRVAGLLLAGTMLAAWPALAQEAATIVPGTDAAATPTRQDPLVAEPATQATPQDSPAATTRTTPATPLALVDGEDVTGSATEIGRQNLPVPSIDGLRTATAPWSDEPPGMRLGTFILRPTIAQGIGYERTKTGDDVQTRSFSTTTLRGILVSDWSLHQLTIGGAGTFEKNFSGGNNTEPEANVDADLRLDLSADTTANLTAGYSLEREDAADPNAIANAEEQSAVQTFRGGASIQRDFGLIRGTLGADIERTTYGDVELSNGSELSQSDRNNTEGVLTGRIGYEVSPALIPFIEAAIGRVRYDDARDSAGFARSGDVYAARTGVELDLGEKLRGEFALGYDRETYDDERLKTINAFSVDGSMDWSPQRGTNVNLGLRTSIEPSTTPGESGYISYLASADITHEMRSNVVARLAGSYEWRDFPTSAASNQNVYIIGTGLTWGLNRYLALSGDVSYELTAPETGANTGVTRAGLGLVLRR
ncbi:hypothetical protein J2Y48_004117 [Mycoplana sp. BE70]|uniref:outer membrane beta-barrel protein n=1 Tax=Mycoplana sp. BE70 TaxID=2817775 RepID=UPI002861F7E9|nr:outer membrane beta-barrel protein [Mycoplana sp. BE70]MDR6758809.1 hypothetical protein [Mycoplana sp. BE70]